MVFSIHPKNPDERKIKQVVDILLNGGVIIYPTDTVYGLGCSIYQPKAIEKIYQIKNLQPSKSHLSFICNDLSHLSEFTNSIDTPLFRMLKEYTPGPFTFILPAGKQAPKLLLNKSKTVGIRVPDNHICNELVKCLGHPIVSTSIPLTDNEIYLNDPDIIFERFGNRVDAIIDGGMSGVDLSTIIDCTKLPPEVIRQGVGIFKE